MARKTKSLLALPQTDDIWYCAVRKLRTFVHVDEDGEEYFRPAVIMVVDVKTGWILMVEIIREPISALDLNNQLLSVMLKPREESRITAHRPIEIHFEDEALTEALQPLLAEAQVTARFQPQRDNMGTIVHELEQRVFGGGDYPRPAQTARGKPRADGQPVLRRAGLLPG